jgi:hypothetical protein
VRRLIVLATTLSLLLVPSCAGQDDEPRGPGTIRGTFHLGDRILRDGWVEMIQLTGPAEERCGPGDCGLAAGLLFTGTDWNPGTWRVVAPDVTGWVAPDPFEIVVSPGGQTTFERSYRPA